MPITIPTKELTGNDLLAILDHVVESEADFYDATSQFDYLVTLAETVSSDEEVA